MMTDQIMVIFIVALTFLGHYTLMGYRIHIYALTLTCISYFSLWFCPVSIKFKLSEVDCIGNWWYTLYEGHFGSRIGGRERAGSNFLVS
jgi:hypothetical protein